MPETPPDESRVGWAGGFPNFRASDRSAILARLRAFIPDAGERQERAWSAALPLLQREVGKVLDADETATDYSSVLEYLLFLEQRRADVLFLVAGPVLVLELKGHFVATQAALDQVAAYARDLAAYHRHCADRPVRAVLVPTGARGELRQSAEGVWIVAPDRLAELVLRLAGPSGPRPVDLTRFLDLDAYQPLPSLVEAAREVFHHGNLSRVWKADAKTAPTVDYILDLTREAAQTRTRHLVLVSGAPGAGKTLVGLRVAHSPTLAALSSPRTSGRSSSPAVFLSGNGPLVSVLQYALKSTVFVRHMKGYLGMYVPATKKAPPENVFVFDEAQRAFSANRVRDVHPKWKEDLIASEPELFIRICDRVPDWTVIVGLIGTGQEIHRGEEGGIRQWRHALAGCPDPQRWTVHAPPVLFEEFRGGSFGARSESALALNFSLRFHLADQLNGFVGRLLDESQMTQASAVSDRVIGAETLGVRLWMTRDLEAAKAYLRERYRNDKAARFGIAVSARAKGLEEFGIDGSRQEMRFFPVGPWFVDPPDSASSCCQLRIPVTEFDIQGLELDMVLLAWGKDLRRERGRWTIVDSKRYQQRKGITPIEDPMRLRLNAYRVLLTRGRDGTIIFVPPAVEMNETWDYLLARGIRPLPMEPAVEHS